MFSSQQFFAAMYAAKMYTRSRSYVPGGTGGSRMLGAGQYKAALFKAGLYGGGLKAGAPVDPPVQNPDPIPSGVWTRIGRDSQGWARIGRDSQAWTEQTPDTQVWIRAGSIGGEGGGGGYDNVWELTEVGGALNWFESN